MKPLVINESMRRFVIHDIAKVRNARLRVQRLIDKLAKHGYYTASYESSLTQSAQSTFESKRGNCLSHTHLFIALARASGLDARYEIVDAPPTYSAERGVLEHQMHIRAKVLLPSRMRGSQYLTVDFNETPNRQSLGRLVSDRFAKSLHYGNDAVAHWLRDDATRAFAHLVKAIKLEPRHADHWVNLATFYIRNGQGEEGLLIHRYALSLNPQHMVALAGIVGYSDGAEFSRARKFLEARRGRNPYYQLALAKRAHHHGHFLEALDYVERSISLDRTNPELLSFKGEVLMRLTDYLAARESYAQALRYAETSTQRASFQDAILSAERAAEG